MSTERVRIRYEIASIERARASLQRREARVWQDFRRWARPLSGAEFELEHRLASAHQKVSVITEQDREEAARSARAALGIAAHFGNATTSEMDELRIDALLLRSDPRTPPLRPIPTPSNPC